MATGYVRADTANNIADGNIINAEDFDLEYDAIQTAFNATTGHNHDGTTGGGAPILNTGPAQDFVYNTARIEPKTDNTYDLGSPTKEFKDLYIDGVANIDSLVADTAAITGGTINNTVIGGTTPLAGTFTTVTATTSVLGTATITGGTINGATIGGTTPAAGTFSTLSSASAAITGGTINGTVIGGTTPAAGTFSTLSSASAAITGGTISGTSISNSSIAMTNNNIATIRTATFNSQPTIATTSGAITIDWTTAQNQKQTEPTGSITYTFTAPAGPCHLQLLIDSDGTSTAQVFVWPGSVIWLNSVWSGINNKRAVINFWYDGTNYYAIGSNQA